MFILKQLVRDQITFYNNRYGNAPQVIEILEEEFLDRVSIFLIEFVFSHGLIYFSKI